MHKFKTLFLIDILFTLYKGAFQFATSGASGGQIVQLSTQGYTT